MGLILSSFTEIGVTVPFFSSFRADSLLISLNAFFIIKSFIELLFGTTNLNSVLNWFISGEGNSLFDSIRVFLGTFLTLA